ncbi:pentapeptide repeat-containing protein [Rhizobium laguerreae]|nr:pentapeptide repeat-containing protein [Rhizobium laguerreae]
MTPRKAANQKQIFDVDGDLLHEGRSPSLKAFVEQCVKAGKSLKRANLKGLDLMHLNLSRADFSGAWLDGAKLRGSKLEHTIFTGASMRGVAASGVDAVSAVFADVDFSPYEVQRAYDDGRINADGSPQTRTVRLTADFVGAQMTCARFDGAKVHEVDFKQAAMSSSSYVGAHIRKSSFKDTYLHNADWADAKIVGNAFDGANMTPRMNVDARHLPDRTRNATIVGNSYQRTEFGSCNRGFVRDAFAVGKIRLATLGLVTSGLFVATSAIPFDLEGTMNATLGKTATFILAASALTWIKTPVEDWFKDKAIDVVAGTSVKVRSAISEMWKRGKSIGSLAVALMSRGHADHVEMILKRRHGGFFERFSAAAKGEYDVVVCDREHLAEALARISEMMNGRIGHKHSVILVRMGDEAFDIPRALVVNGDGGLEALWDENTDGVIVHKAWDEAKIPIGERGHVEAGRFLAPFNSHISVVSKFMTAILAEHGLADFKVRHETHLVRQGLDGSIVVTKQKDGRLDNLGAPTVITPDNKPLYFRNSVAYDAQGQRIRREEPQPAGIPFGPR